MKQNTNIERKPYNSLMFLKRYRMLFISTPLTWLKVYDLGF